MPSFEFSPNFSHGGTEDTEITGEILKFFKNLGEKRGIFIPQLRVLCALCASVSGIYSHFWVNLTQWGKFGLNLCQNDTIYRHYAGIECPINYGVAIIALLRTCTPPFFRA